MNFGDHVNSHWIKYSINHCSFQKLAIAPSGAQRRNGAVSDNKRQGEPMERPIDPSI